MITKYLLMSCQYNNFGKECGTEIKTPRKTGMKIKLFRILAATIVLSGLYTIYKISLFLSDSEDLKTKNKPLIHIPLPPNLKGKQLPFHQIYEPRQVLFPENYFEKSQISNKSYVSEKTKVILLWTPWNGVQNTINYYSLQLGRESFEKYNCPNSKCFVTRNRTDLQKADVVLFHLQDTRPSDLPSYRIPQQVWILYNMEPPWLVWRNKHPVLPKFRNMFNWTMSYRTTSDIVSRYGFIAPSNDSASVISFRYKTKSIVWFVSDCKTDSRREEYVKELSKYIEVDIYGLCSELKCFPAQSSACYDDILNKYKFYLSFENAICEDYVTEKFFNIFNYDVIPVVYGAANYPVITPEGTYIDATKYPNPKALAQVLLEIGQDEELYNEFLLRKKAFKAFLDPWTCRLCDKLHSNVSLRVLDDVEKWWLKEGYCKTWDKKQLTFVNSTLKV